MKIGESWECWDDDAIARGPLAGRTLAQARQVLGKLIAQRQLPKLWDVRARLVELFEAERGAGEGGGSSGARPIGHGDS